VRRRDSTAAFKASRLVWKAMLSMTLVMSPIRHPLSEIRAVALVASPVTSVARCAIFRVSRPRVSAVCACSALRVTLAVSSSIAAAVSSRALTWAWVRWARSSLPWATRLTASAVLALVASTDGLQHLPCFRDERIEFQAATHLRGHVAHDLHDPVRCALGVEQRIVRPLDPDLASPLAEATVGADERLAGSQSVR
jgi:hypothetical protein